MKNFKKILLGLVIVLVLAIVGGYSYMMLAFPAVSDPAEITVEITEARLVRGKYLAEHVALCMDCHSQRDYTKFAGPVIPGTLGRGGEKFGEEMGLPGNFYASNLTPANLKNWTDGEIFRAIAAGVGRDGRALFPIMPYPNFGRMSKEDIYSIIAYLRLLPPIEATHPPSEASFPMSLIMRTIPSNPPLGTRPDPSNKIAYGKYLVTAGSCGDCHTPAEKGEPLPGMDYAGSFAMELPGGTLRSANITPDKETGIGNWTEDMFVQRFKAYADSSYVDPVVAHGEFQTVMPWRMYAGMEEQDLRAIFAYLQTLKPVRNPVERFTPRK